MAAVYVWTVWPSKPMKMCAVALVADSDPQIGRIHGDLDVTLGVPAMDETGYEVNMSAYALADSRRGTVVVTELVLGARATTG